MPRNRVFSQYATKCGNERVPPLNPASFGKLVRIIFPGIQTRRLGMRGESKYHYVDLQMREDVPDDGQHDAPAHYNAANHLDEKSAFRRLVSPCSSTDDRHHIVVANANAKAFLDALDCHHYEHLLTFVFLDNECRCQQIPPSSHSQRP